MKPPVFHDRGAAARGFTLVELAVVIAIVGFLLGAILVPLSTQWQAQKIRETERNLTEIKAVLTGFAAINGRLPCPDTNADDLVPDGLEDAPCPVAAGLHPEGYLPWVTLGVPPEDAWGHLYLYGVTAEHTVAAIPGSGTGVASLDMADAGAFTVMTRDDSKTSVALSTNASAVVVSLGANGSVGGRSASNTGALAAPAGLDEADNYYYYDPGPPVANSAAPDNQFVSRVHSRGTVPCDDTTTNPTLPLCEFDDIVSWLPTALLIGKLVAAGHLP